MQHAVNDLGDRRPLERQAAREHLVEHDAEREQIGTVIDRPSQRLLRRHVRHGPEHDPRRRHPRHRRGFRGVAGFEEAGETEVEHLHAPAIVEHEVRALDVPVDDAGAVRFLQRLGDLRGDIERRRRIERSLAEPRRQQLARDVLHDDERGPLVLADVVCNGNGRRA